MYLESVIRSLQSANNLLAEDLYKLNEALFNLPEEDTIDKRTAKKLFDVMSKIRKAYMDGKKWYDKNDVNFYYDYIAVLGTMQNQQFVSDDQHKAMMSWLQEAMDDGSASKAAAKQSAAAQKEVKKLEAENEKLKAEISKMKALAGAIATITKFKSPKPMVTKDTKKEKEKEKDKKDKKDKKKAEKGEGEKKPKPTVCVCGAGNAAHVFIPYFNKQGYTVNVFADFQDEAERLKKAMDENDGITILDRCNPKNVKEYKGKAAVVSKEAADAVPQADYIIVALPSFALRNVLTGLKPHLKAGAIVYIMPGQGGADFVAKEILGEEIKAGKVTVAGIIPMPLNCRIDEFGKKVQLAAFKSVYDLASIPAKKAPQAARVLSKLLRKKVRVIGNYAGISLHASNPNIHPGRVYSLFKDFAAGKTYPENPLFYETWDDDSSEWVQKISDERVKIWETICEKFPSAGKPKQVPHIKPYIEAIYKGQIADTSTLAKCFNTNDGFKGFKSPMKEEGGAFVPDFKNRYFTEDFPEGFCMYKGIADLAGVETPTIDTILGFFQKFMGKEYLKDGKLAGADVKETKSPQAFGVTSLEALLQDS